MKNTNIQVFFVTVSMAYFIYDLIACVIFRLVDFGLVLHHSMCMIGFFSGVYYGYGALEGICKIFIKKYLKNFLIYIKIFIQYLMKSWFVLCGGIKLSYAYESNYQEY
jgi:hypothetical protein